VGDAKKLSTWNEFSALEISHVESKPLLPSSHEQLYLASKTKNAICGAHYQHRPST
jgi:hypothetical protein